jgi:ABC-type lipoprotein release transport system permease subunit
MFCSICGVTISIAAEILSYISLRGGHTGLVNNVLNVSPQEEIKRSNIG